MKVKKFKIKPRLPSVGRILKSLLSIKQLPPEVEESLPQESEDFRGHLSPIAFYQTWGQAEMPGSFKEALRSAGAEGGAIAVSALVATIGFEPEDYLSQVLLKGETVRSHVITAFCEESADLSFHFLHRLLLEEAENDNCDLSEPIFISDPGLLSETLGLLEAGQEENITVDPADHLSPRFTRVALLAWWPVAKKRHSALSHKKKSN